MIKKPFYERIKPLLYLLPFIVSVSVFTLYPIVNVIRMSFLEGYKYLSGAYTGVGLGNYEKVLSDPFFRQAISNTFRYVLLVVPISTVIAIVLTTLAVLTLASSNADVVMAERFAGVTKIRYDLESEGYRFVQKADEALKSVRCCCLWYLGDIAEHDHPAAFRLAEH